MRPYCCCALHALLGFVSSQFSSLFLLTGNEESSVETKSPALLLNSRDMTFRRRRKTRKEKEILGQDLADDEYDDDEYDDDDDDDDDDDGLAGFLQGPARLLVYVVTALNPSLGGHSQVGGLLFLANSPNNHL